MKALQWLLCNRPVKIKTVKQEIKFRVSPETDFALRPKDFSLRTKMSGELPGATGHSDTVDQ